jgi:DNA-binding transcriptional LysR family regulator
MSDQTDDVSMELYQLRSFVIVAEEGHLTRAAQRLNTSQPAVSAHIKALEEELGVTLFVRTPKGMELTKEGELLKTQAEKCLTDANELLHQAKRLHGNLIGVIKIGVNTYPEILKISQFLSAMAANYPKLECHLIQSTSWKVPEQLRTGTLDAGYIYGSNSASDLAVIPLRTCHLYIAGAVAWKDRLAQADWQTLSTFPWVCASEVCPFQARVQEQFRKHQLEPSTVAVADDESTMKNLVITGVGLGLLLEEDALSAEREGKVVLWRQETFPMELSFVYIRKREHDPVIQAAVRGIELVWGRSTPLQNNLTR